MSGLDRLKMRVQYLGGKDQVDRMNMDKLRSLKKALLYSYQSATAVLADGREFRCLINPDHIKNTYDNKYISIPFEDICLNNKKVDNTTTTKGIQTIGMKCGDVFTWKEQGTDWLVYLRRFEETAYFRAEIRRCKYTVDVNGKTYKVYAARPSTNEIDWRNVSKKLWNDIDYTLQMYITKDENTEAFFHRFSVVCVNGKPWEVQAVDNMSSDGIITMYLKEWYQNTIKNEVEKEQEDKKQDEPDHKEDEPYIEGETKIYPYDEKEYTIKNAEGGKWEISSSKVKITSQTDKNIKISVLTGRSTNFEIKYIRDNEEDIVLKVTVSSL